MSTFPLFNVVLGADLSTLARTSLLNLILVLILVLPSVILVVTLIILVTSLVVQSALNGMMFRRWPVFSLLAVVDDKDISLDQTNYLALRVC